MTLCTEIHDLSMTIVKAVDTIWLSHYTIHVVWRPLSSLTVLSGAKERVAKERPGWNIQIFRNMPG